MGCCLWGRTESDMTEVTQQQQQQLLTSRSGRTALHASDRLTKKGLIDFPTKKRNT